MWHIYMFMQPLTVAEFLNVPNSFAAVLNPAMLLFEEI